MVVPTFPILRENRAQKFQFSNKHKYVGSDVMISTIFDQNYNQSQFCEISGSHSGVTEDPSPLGCDCLFLGE